MNKNLPTGIVTFLFTDIEGSTKLWEQFPEAMKGALKRHDELVRAKIENHTGYIFKTVGDAFYAVFVKANDALQAAIAIQHILRNTTWSDDVREIRVRIALHTGIPEEREGDFFGPPLNRTARLLSAAHGGQILLTHTTQEYISDRLSEGIHLRDLGERRLKDLLRPERIYQVVAPGLTSEFPPLMTLDAHLNNLPSQSTSFVGREREIAAILALMRDPWVKLVTLTGPGGTGKTRLSLQVAIDLIDEYEHGVWFIELAPITDPTLILRTVATVLGIKEERGKPLEKVVSDYIQPRQMLLVLDNLEHLTIAASVIHDLITIAPRLKILASSREVLHLRGEHNYPVPPLCLPDIQQRISLASLSQNEAVSLFIQRARAVNPDFTFTEDTASIITDICDKLDGLPLAIELAAAHSRIFTPVNILNRLTRPLEVLTSGARDLPPRQQTIRNTMNWSYNLLNDDEKTLFARLGIFSGGWTDEAAEALCVSCSWDTMMYLESLVDKSLVRSIESKSGDIRFSMLETIREYALEKLSVGGENEILHQQHAEYFVSWVEKAFPLLSGPQQVVWLQRIEDEHDNLRATLSWIVSNFKAELAARLGAVIWRFWFLHSYLTEGRLWMDKLVRVISSGGDVPVLLQVKTLNAAGKLAEEQGDLISAIQWHEQALALARQTGNDNEIANVLNSLGLVFNSKGEYEKARNNFEECLSLSRRMDDQRGIANVLNNLGMIAIEFGDYPIAQKYHEESLAIKRKLGDLWGVASSLNNLGVIARERGNIVQAKRMYQEGLAICRQVGHRMGTAIFLNNLGFAAFMEHDAERAMQFCLESLAIRKELGNKHGMASSLNNLGKISLLQDHPEQALDYWQESLRLLIEIGSKQLVDEIFLGLVRLALHVDQPTQAAKLLGVAETLHAGGETTYSTEMQAEHAECMAELHKRLNDVTINQAWAEGRSLTREQIMEYALSLRCKER